MNIMLEPRIEKVTLNVGVGEGGEKLENAMKIMSAFTGMKPVKTMTMKRIPDFNIRPKMVVGCKVTLRGVPAMNFLKRALVAADNKLYEEQIDSNGNFAFGVKEHIDLPNVKYDPELGIIGLDVCVTMGRRGYRIKQRRLKNTALGKGHVLTKAESIDYISKTFNLKILSREKERAEEEA